VTAENSRNCPDAMQYLGMVVNGVQAGVPIGAYRFPDDEELIALDAPAKDAFARSSFHWSRSYSANGGIEGQRRRKPAIRRIICGEYGA